MNLLKSASRLYAKTKLSFLARSSAEIYHPLPFAGVEGRRGRGTFQRWQAVDEFLKRKGNSHSVLDIGCNSGFFSFELAKQGHFCIGVDSSKRAAMIADLQKEINESEGVCFAHFRITPATVAQLPCCDITLCLSVFHHWALAFGADEATEIMRQIAARTNRVLIFETAQTDGCSEKYRRVLPPMDPNPRVWLDSFLTDLGFREVLSLGAFELDDKGTGRRELMVGVK